MKSPGLGVAIGLVVGLISACPMSAWAGGTRVVQVPPSGGDDTAALQGALDQCVASRQECVVQLSAGTYSTSQLLAYGFHGAFKGSGMHRTTVQPVGTLTVGNGYLPPTAANPYPDLMTFVDGDVTVSDISFDMNVVPSTTPWWGWSGLTSAVRVMGKDRTDATIERISVTGRPDPASPWGYNMINCLILAGELPKPGTDPDNIDWFTDQYRLRGTFKIAGNSLQSCGSAVGLGRIEESFIAATSNTAEDVLSVFELANVESDDVVIADNDARGVAWFGAWVYSAYYRASLPSRFTVRGNRFEVLSEGEGVAFWDNRTPKVWNATVVGNAITIVGEDVYPAIDLWRTEHSLVAANRISGTGIDAIFLGGGATECAIVGNDIRNFTSTPGGASILLDPETSRNLVAGACRPSDVLDLGQDNRVICARE